VSGKQFNFALGALRGLLLHCKASDGTQRQASGLAAQPGPSNRHQYQGGEKPSVTSNLSRDPGRSHGSLLPSITHPMLLIARSLAFQDWYAATSEVEAGGRKSTTSASWIFPAIWDSQKAIGLPCMSKTTDEVPLAQALIACQ